MKEAEEKVKENEWNRKKKIIENERDRGEKMRENEWGGEELESE